MSIVPPDDQRIPLDPGRKRAIIIVGGLVAVMALIVGSAIVLSDGPSTPASPMADPGGTGAPDAAGEDDTDGAEASEALEPEAEVEGPAEAEENVDEEASDEEDPVEEGSQLVGFDGACEVEVDADELRPDPRPWRFAECTGAPVDLDDGDVWIVVLASLSGDEQDEEGARGTASDRDLGDQLLWSDHYPTLNPGWWVVFDGPFDDEDTAASAAQERGGGAYHRLLEDDDDARYCLDDCLEAADTE